MKQFLKLLADNRKRGTFRAQYPIEAKAGDEATIYLYDAVVSDELTAEYWGGVSPQSFVKTLAEIKTDVSSGTPAATLLTRTTCPSWPLPLST